MNTTKLSELQSMIQGTLNAYQGEPMRAERLRALKSIQWRLRGPNGEYVGLSNGDCSFVPEFQALIFNGQDNELQKLKWFQIFLGPLTIEILPQEK